MQVLRIGLKAGGLTGGLLLIVLWPVLFWGAGLAVGASTAIAGTGALTGFLSAYIILHFLVMRRLRYLDKLMQAINKKHFDELPLVKHSRKDELDELITDSAEAAETIRKEFQRLFRLENYRKEFIGDISHELKTPIFAIQGFVETLLEGALEDGEVNRLFLRKTMKNVKRLTLLTYDLMEISKLETGELKSHIQPLFLSDVLHEVNDALSYRLEKEQVELHISPVDDDLRVHADRNQLRQVLINLIDNGIKYNEGEIKVWLSIKPDQLRGETHISIIDNGIGIGEKHLPRITERFFRVDKSRSRDKGGTGLGLAIVKHILEAHGTHLRVESQKGKGSEFSFSLRNADSVSA
jgi:two-component system phosphate regulon sensor histidine kinase PhoR